MDISQIKNKSGSHGTPFEIRHPATNEIIMNEERPTRIWMVGKDTQAYRKIKADVYKQFKNVSNVTFEIRDAMECEILARATTKLENFPWEGELIEYSKDFVLKLYKNPEFLWLKEQADKHLGDRSNFLGESPQD